MSTNNIPTSDTPPPGSNITSYSQTSIPKVTLANGDYIALRLIAHGGFSSVYKAQSTANQLVYAVKTIKRHDDAEKSCSQDELIMNEVNIIKELNHPSIIAYAGHYALEDEFHIALEFAPGGTLLQKAPVTHKQAKAYTLDIARAIDFLHQNNIIHCDLKPENVLLTSNNRIKLADFGLAKRSFFGTATGAGGTPYAKSPEVIRGESFTKAVDYWGLGITLYIIVKNKDPFDHPTLPGLNLEILFAEVEFSPIDLPTFSSLVQSLLKKDPEERLSSLEGVEKHVYFDSNICVFPFT
ncbi:kinase-like domain-containing protein [Melampsora americana]|nr:kinase-like domain-containing protein [Melampsora americana]